MKGEMYPMMKNVFTMNFLMVVSLAFFGLTSYASVPSSFFLGEWGAINMTGGASFTLRIIDIDENSSFPILKGNVEGVGENAGRIDSLAMEDVNMISIVGLFDRESWDESEVYDGFKLVFYSSHSSFTGVAKITVDEKNRLIWKILIEPEDQQYYLPREAVLEKKP